MSEVLANIEWQEALSTIWTVILLPILSYIGKEIKEWAKSKKIDKYTDILIKNAKIAVKDVYQTIVSNIDKSDPNVWTDEKKAEIKEIAKSKTIQGLSNIAYECLKQANMDFEEYLDSLIESSLFDIKNK